MCFENYFSCYRGKVKTQLLIVRITWGREDYFPGSLLFYPFSQPSVFPVRFTQLSFFIHLTNICWWTSVCQTLWFLSPTLVWTPQVCVVFCSRTDPTHVIQRGPIQVCTGLDSLWAGGVLWAVLIWPLLTYLRLFQECWKIWPGDIWSQPSIFLPGTISPSLGQIWIEEGGPELFQCTSWYSCPERISLFLLKTKTNKQMKTKKLEITPMAS